VASKPAGQKVHIDALVLAFSHSRASSLVGTDALRTVLSGQYRELVKGGTFYLDEVWGLLESQPGFDPALVKPPLCRFKLWSDELGLEVALPAAMGRLEPLEIRSLAEQCRVPGGDLDRVLGRGRHADAEAGAQKKAKAAASKPARAKAGAAPPRRPAPAAPAPGRSRGAKRSRPVLLAVAAVVAVAGFTVAGVFAYKELRSVPWQEVSTGFSGGIPLTRAERSGFDVAATLADEAWLKTPIERRRQQLEEAVEKLRREGVRNLLVRDKKGTVRATAQSYGRPPKVKVRFY
jgi:hypothetical protein